MARASRAGTRGGWSGAVPVFLAVVAAFVLAGPVREHFVPRARGAARGLRLSPGVDSATFVTDPAVQDNTIVRALGAERTWVVLTRPDLVATAAADVFPAVLIILLPFFAALTWLAWRPERLDAGVHGAFALDLHSAVFATLTVSALADWSGITALTVAAGAGAVVYTTWYAWVACREALGGTSPQLVWRTTVVAVLYTPPAIALAFVLALRAVR